MEIGKQVNKDNAKVYNIDLVNVNPAYTGSAFVSAADCIENKKYHSKKDRLYYPPQYLEDTLALLTSEHRVLIQGEQGSGKTILSFKLAELLISGGFISSAYYLNSPSDWNMVKQWIQSVRFQAKVNHDHGSYLWIIDNLQKLDNAVEEFPEPSVWGQDYCICCSRDLNSVLPERDIYAGVALSEKQVVRRNIDQEIFFNCFHVMSDVRIGRRESDDLYQYIAGNLAMLGYLIDNGEIQHYLANQDKENAMDFSDIYERYFVRGKAAGDKITHENCMDTLKMLFLSQIDFSVPIYVQLNVCVTVLKDYYTRNYNEELEFEHASLAEIFTKCICWKHRIDYKYFFKESLRWTLAELVKPGCPTDEKIMQTNRFLQLLFDYKFILSDNKEMQKNIFCDKSLTEFLAEYVCFISCSTWKKIIPEVKDDSIIKDIFRNHVLSSHFAESLINNCDYDFQFCQVQLTPDEIREMETQLLLYGADLIESVMKNKNEIHLLRLLHSLSEDSAADFLGQVSSKDIIGMLLANDNGLFLFARYYSMFTEKIQTMLDAMITTDGYIRILKSSASITGFSCLLAYAGDASREKFCCLLEQQDLVCGLIENTVNYGYTIGTLSFNLRVLKTKFPKTLNVFEKALGMAGYVKLLENQGTIPNLVRLIQYSSKEMQSDMCEMLQASPELVEKLVERTIQNGGSIGTLDLSLRGLKKESEGALEVFERSVGAAGYKKLLESQGTIPILAELIRYSSKKMKINMFEMIKSDEQLVTGLVDKTVQMKGSIGMFNYSIRALAKNNYPFLQLLENNIGTDGYFACLLYAMQTLSRF